MDAVYLKINGIEFTKESVLNYTTKGVVVEKDRVYRHKLYNLEPSSVTPATDIIKTVQRALDGTAVIDITAVKQNIKVVFDLLDNSAFDCVLSLLNLKNTDITAFETMHVEYFDFRGTNTKRTAECYFDGLSYVPFIDGDEIRWRDVTLSFCEI